MLWALRSEAKHLEATCEWHLVNEQGQLCADGQYVWIEQFELSQGASMSYCAKRLIEDIARQCPWTVAVYWRREDKTGHQAHQFSRAQVLRYAEKGVMV